MEERGRQRSPAVSLELSVHILNVIGVMLLLGVVVPKLLSQVKETDYMTLFQLSCQAWVGLFIFAVVGGIFRSPSGSIQLLYLIIVDEKNCPNQSGGQSIK